ncbi:hypothetical protein BDA99DRAFT_568495 [Phascolomyces articulosus]|uniref:WH1-domain-containing protein n=1 Tax=Phascolomyces articulosus TaxID=60185 RepID=A0AAD5K9Y5_9FUNG|nr:hypothetical protein BDA99DRAFT_568495 [Phascolomyces articulosus]
MPTVTLPTPADKSIVRKALPNASIYTAAVARLVIAFPDPEVWSHTGVWGAATLCKENGSYYIRIIDIENHTGILWEHELYQDFDFVQEAGFFYTFDTDDYIAGLEFVEEEEGETFYKKLVHRESIQLKAAANKQQQQPKQHAWRDKLRKKRIDKGLIGSPADFRHTGHIGFTQEKGFTVEGESGDIIGQLKSLGITAQEIEQNKGFIQEFMSKYDQEQQPVEQKPSSFLSPSSSSKGIQQQRGRPRAPSSPLPPAPQSNVYNREQYQKSPTPPPPPLSQQGRRKAPPPPPPRRARAATHSSVTQQQQPISPLPPPLPSRHPQQQQQQSIPPPPAPPPPPSFGISSAPIPPPPPPHPSLSSSVPVAPPPLPPSSAPPPPVTAPQLPPGTATDGRADLMASIRQAGGFGTLKQGGKLRNADQPPPPSSHQLSTSEPTSSGGGITKKPDLASSLAAAIQQRKQAMGSDDEDDTDDDEEWA